MLPRLQEKYLGEIRPALMEEFSIKNLHAVPRLDKISINMGIGKARENQKHLDEAIRDLGLIAGQKAVVTRARKSIAQFHIREGCPVRDREAIGSNECRYFAARQTQFISL